MSAVTIELREGDILRADAEALVNTVNCVGFMGRGIAAQFKRAYPANFEVYRKACIEEEVVPGRLLITETGELTGPRYIVNFPTKRHWRAKSRIEDIEAGLEALVSDVRVRGIRSIAIPPLGCGLGGLRWADVRPRIERAFEGITDVHILLFEPKGAPSVHAMARKAKNPGMTRGRAVLVSLMERYLAGVMDPWVTLLEVHKLMYFAQESGEPLRLRFKAAHYGPYAENLRHVLTHIEGHFVTGYADGGDEPDKPLELVPGVAERARRTLAKDAESQARFDRVATIVDGFETPSGLELLASVHWLARREGLRDPKAVVERLYAWSPAKKRFSEHQVQVALRRLQDEGWLEHV